jgi:hypothetical protein
MSAWIQVAGYADDLQVAYDHHKLGGPIASQRFWERYQRTIDSIIVYRRASLCDRTDGDRNRSLDQFTASSMAREDHTGCWLAYKARSRIQIAFKPCF